MIIDLVELVTNNVDAVNISVEVSYDDENLKSVGIKELKNTLFEGKVRKLYDDEYELEGILSGVMVLADDITLEDVDYEFNINLKEDFNEYDESEDYNLKIINNKLDINEFLWQNIVLEIPSKVVSDASKDVKLEGNGWRFVTEEELDKEKSDKSPFAELDDRIK